MMVGLAAARPYVGLPTHPNEGMIQSAPDDRLQAAGSRAGTAVMKEQLVIIAAGVILAVALMLLVKYVL
jgi:hypothetical protein